MRGTSVNTYYNLIMPIPHFIHDILSCSSGYTHLTKCCSQILLTAQAILEFSLTGSSEHVKAKSRKLHIYTTRKHERSCFLLLLLNNSSAAELILTDIATLTNTCTLKSHFVFNIFRYVITSSRKNLYSSVTFLIHYKSKSKNMKINKEVLSLIENS